MKFNAIGNLKLAEWVLFLDFDGTLVDIAATPQSIVVPPDLMPLLMELLTAFEGRVCIVSGRTLSDLTHYLKPITIDIVAEHGAVTVLRGIDVAQLSAWPTSWNEHLLTLDHCIPSLVVEKKHTSIALHYRQQPELEPEVILFAEQLRNHAPAEYIVVNSNMTTEIRRSDTDKGSAIRAVMDTPRYQGKRPIFIADDITDIPGFDAARELGGLAINVTTDFAGQTANVRHWLNQLAKHQKVA